jgi:peroxisomal 3,2-trans-enoyl-CoA isomerase
MANQTSSPEPLSRQFIDDPTTITYPNSSPELLSVEYTGRIAIITLNKPDKLNSLTKDEYHELAALLREVDTHDEVFVTVLIGTGRFFSA